MQPNREHADEQIEQARQHLVSARQLLTQLADLEGCAALLYDAARKALSAVLANQGLRATSKGGHLAVYAAVSAQLVPPLGATIKPFDRLRRQRNRSEYPSGDRWSTVPLNGKDLADDIVKSDAIVQVCATVLDSMPVF